MLGRVAVEVLDFRIAVLQVVSAVVVARLAGLDQSLVDLVAWDSFILLMLVPSIRIVAQQAKYAMQGILLYP